MISIIRCAACYLYTWPDLNAFDVFVCQPEKNSRGARKPWFSWNAGRAGYRNTFGGTLKYTDKKIHNPF
jgi:hypothetical protein